MNNELLKRYIKILEKMEDKKKDKLDIIISQLHKFWWKYALYIMATSIILLFIFSFIFDKVISINTMNSWVGVVLGLVATVIGIISMFLSFYNLDQSIKTQDKTLETIDRIKNEIIASVDRNSEKTINEIHKNTYQSPDYFNMSNKGDWENVKK